MIFTRCDVIKFAMEHFLHWYPLESLFIFIVTSFVPLFQNLNVQLWQISSTTNLFWLEKFSCAIVKQIFSFFELRLARKSGLKSRYQVSNHTRLTQINGFKITWSTMSDIIDELHKNFQILGCFSISPEFWWCPPLVELASLLPWSLIRNFTKRLF